MTTGAAFSAALRDPAAAAPPGLHAPGGRAAGARFDVYRNNVAVGLTEALETGFPVVRRLVGEAFFRAMAGVFVRAHPPASPVLWSYGAALPDFLEGFPPAAGLPYLADVARVELDLRRAYHAADAVPMPADALARLAPDRLMAARLHLAPAVAVLRSPYPVHAIWAANGPAGDGRVAASGAQAVLITRPGFDPVADPIAPGAAAFLDVLAEGRPLGAAIDRAGPDLDLAVLLRLLLDRQALTHLEEGPAP